MSPQKAGTLILALGNPIAGDDQIGLRVGSRLAGELAGAPGIEFREFTGSPLDLVAEAGTFDRLILIDAVVTGRERGTVVSFSEEELAGGRGDTYPHGLNVPEALALGRRMGLPLPRRISLIGVEVVPPQGFSAELSPELAARLEEIARQVRRTLLHLLGS